MFDGVLNIYKEKGYTSHDVVAKLRGILRERRIGHTGTLDPDAEGVLPICVGKATRLCDMLTDKDKTYEAVLLLGRETDTQDISGRICREMPVEVTQEEVREAIMGFVGVYEQLPPMYSAVKVNGKKLYELARKGQVVERKPRPVTIHEIVLGSVCLPRVTMTVCCSKGTYIRTLCHDIGQSLGCGGCMESLARTRSGRFRVEDSLRLSEIERLRDSGELDRRFLSIEELLDRLPSFTVLPQADRLVRNGNPFGEGDVAEGPRKEDAAPRGTDGHVRVYDSGGRFMGIYEWEQDKARFTPWKMFLGGSA